MYILSTRGQDQHPTPAVGAWRQAYKACLPGDGLVRASGGEKGDMRGREGIYKFTWPLRKKAAKVGWVLCLLAPNELVEAGRLSW